MAASLFGPTPYSRSKISEVGPDLVVEPRTSPQPPCHQLASHSSESLTAVEDWQPPRPVSFLQVSRPGPLISYRLLAVLKVLTTKP